MMDHAIVSAFCSNCFVHTISEQCLINHLSYFIITTVVKLRYVSFIIKLLLDWIGLD